MKHEIKFYFKHGYTERTTTAPTIKAALAKAQRIHLDDTYDDLIADAAHYDEVGDLQSIEVMSLDSDGERTGDCIEWVHPQEKIRQAGHALFAAAHMVLQNWNKGNLAGAVNLLQEAYDEAGGDEVFKNVE